MSRLYTLNTGTDVTYTINFEDLHLDLDFISKKLSSPCGAGKLSWNITGVCEEDSYREVDIYAEKIAPKRKDEKIERDSRTISDKAKSWYPCYLCNVKVPNAFKTKHEASAKHKGYLHIAKITLERLKKFLNADISVDVVDNKESDYFCESCVLVMKQSDRAVHDKSKSHVLSAMQDKLLTDLYIIDDDFDKESDYGTANEFLTENSKTKSTTIDSKNEIIKEKRFIENEVTSNESELSFYSDNETVNDKDLMSNTLIVNESTTVDKIDKMLNNLFSDNSVDDSNNTESKIVDNANEIVNNASKNYNVKTSVSEVDSSNYVRFKYELNKEDDLPYIKRLVETFPNPNIKVRVVDDKIKIKATNGEAVIVKFENFHGFYNFQDEFNAECQICYRDRSAICINNHKYSDVHMEKLMADIEDGNCIRKLDARWSHCLLCNKILYNSGVNSHIEDGTHITNKSNYACVDNEELSAEDDSESYYLDDFIKTLNSRRSDYVKLTNKLYLEVTAENGDRFTTNLDEFNGYKKTDAKTECLLCMEQVHSKIKHAMTVEHLDYVRILVRDAHGIRKLNESETHCVICNKVTKTKKLVKHKQSVTHSVLMMARQFQVLSNVVKDKIAEQPQENISERTLYCDLCRMYIGASSIDNHMQTKAHKMNVFQRIGVHINSINFFQNTETPMIVRCWVCLKTVSYNMINIENHVMGSVHVDTVYTLVNCLEAVPQGYYCRVCDITFIDIYLFPHLAATYHRERCNLNTS